MRFRAVGYLDGGAGGAGPADSGAIRRDGSVIVWSANVFADDGGVIDK